MATIFYSVMPICISHTN
uniref:Uncharacterized protein n=1 Tax=Anguilla anguilla TaxID=7936 RepID=A0A0E9XPB2_ANGAN